MKERMDECMARDYVTAGVIPGCRPEGVRSGNSSGETFQQPDIGQASLSPSVKQGCREN